jgi:hypothetical protein
MTFSKGDIVRYINHPYPIGIIKRINEPPGRLQRLKTTYSIEWFDVPISFSTLFFSAPFNETEIDLIAKATNDIQER